MLVAQLGGREATLDHRHQRLAAAGLEDELDLELDDRSVRPAFGRVEDEATGPVDHPKDVVVAEALVARGPDERHSPEPADAQIALGLDTPARLAVEGLLAVLPGERVEDHLGPGVDHARDSHVLAHRPASFLSTYVPNRSSR